MRYTQGQEYYCRVCMRYLAPTGKRVPYAEDAEVIIWVECGSCERRRLEKEAAEEARRRREEERTRPRACELDGCNETYVPGTRWQTYCCDEHRWAAHRLRRAGARVNGSRVNGSV